MSIRELLLGLAILGNASAAAAAPSGTYMRLLLHGARTVDEDSGMGVAAWTVAPNITGAPDRWFLIAGPRYAAKNWWVEIMGGAVAAGSNRTPLVDLRAEFSGAKPFYTWVNLQWIDPKRGSNSQFCWYVQADYILGADKPLALLGVEIENTMQQGPDVWSVGPHILLPFGMIVMQAAYQFHKYEESQLWFRCLVNF